jgi:hypothetical protein
MLATVRTTVLPEFSVDVYPVEDESLSRHRYVLVLRDGTAGAVELVFSSPQDLRAFLREARDAFNAARQEVQARKSRFGSRPHRFGQLTLF